MSIPRNSLMVSYEALLLLEEMCLWMLARIMEACQRQRVRIMEACQRQRVRIMEACQRQRVRIMEACQRQRVRIMEACQRQLVKEIFCSSRLKFRRFEHLSGSVPFSSAAIHDSGYRSSVYLVIV